MANSIRRSLTSLAPQAILALLEGPAYLIFRCKGSPETVCKGCHETEHSQCAASRLVGTHGSREIVSARMAAPQPERLRHGDAHSKGAFWTRLCPSDISPSDISSSDK